MNKYLLTILISAFVLIGAGCEENPLGAGQGPAMKAQKANVLGSTRGNGVVKYAYKGGAMDTGVDNALINRVASSSNRAVIAEKLDKRTKHSRTFETDEPGRLVTEIVSGEPQYYEDPQGNWFRANYATTTEEVFDIAMKNTLLENIARILKPQVLAQAGPFYPEVGTTGDGRVYYNGAGLSFAAIIAANGTDADHAASTNFWLLEADSTIDQYVGYRRSEFAFDSSAIGAGQQVDTATFSVYGNAKADALNISDNDESIHIVQATFGDVTTVTASDYQAMGGTSFGSVDYTNFDATDSAYTDITLNAIGRAAVSITGNTEFGIKVEADVITGADTNITWGSGLVSNMNGYFSEETGTTKDPKLTVTHSAAPTDTCTPPAAGTTWAVEASDGCGITSDTSHNGNLECFGTGAFTVESGVTVSIYGNVNCPQRVIRGKFIQIPN